MQLNKLIKNIAVEQQIGTIQKEVFDIQFDSRLVKTGSLFVAQRGVAARTGDGGRDAKRAATAWHLHLFRVLVGEIELDGAPRRSGWRPDESADDRAPIRRLED